MASFYSFRALIVSLAFLLLLPLMGYSQAATVPDKPFDYVEQIPEYPGGNGAIIKHMAENVRYPAKALRKSVRGKVYVKFIVDETGQVIEPVVQRGIGSGCDAEAVRVVRQLARFTPGRQNGQPVKVYYNVPISFSITKLPPTDWNPSHEGDEGVVYDRPQVPISHVGLTPAQEGGLYSQPAPRPGVRDAVTVRFLLDTEGRVQAPYVDEKLTPAADSVALRLVAASSGWQPARQGGITVLSHLEHTILFGLERRPDVFYAPQEPAVYLSMGPDALATHLRRAISYPEAARVAKREGTVTVRVVVDTTGRVTEPEIVEGRGNGLDEEALRVVQTLEGFRPARYGGKPVASYLLVPVRFSLPKE